MYKNDFSILIYKRKNNYEQINNDVYSYKTL